MPEVDAVNSGYARVLLEQYLENPEAVPSEWRELFESGDGDLIESLPGLARLLENLRETNGHTEPAPAPAVAHEPTLEAVPTAPDDELLGGVAAAMSLVKALRTHGHLAARLDPLGSEPVGDPALEPERLQPRLTPELQARIPASLLRVHTPGETLAEVLPKLQETYSSTSAESGCARRSSPGATAASSAPKRRSACSRACPRSKASSTTSDESSSARSSSPSRASTR